MQQLEEWFFQQGKPFLKVWDREVSAASREKVYAYNYPPEAEQYSIEPTMDDSWAALMQFLSQMQPGMFVIGVQSQPSGPYSQVKISTRPKPVMPGQYPAGAHSNISGMAGAGMMTIREATLLSNKGVTELRMELLKKQLDDQIKYAEELEKTQADNSPIMSAIRNSSEIKELCEAIKSVMVPAGAMIAGIMQGRPATAIGTVGVNAVAPAATAAQVASTQIAKHKVSDMDLEALRLVMSIVSDYNQANGLSGDTAEHPLDLLQDIDAAGKNNPALYVMLRSSTAPSSPAAVAGTEPAAEPEQISIMPPRNDAAQDG